MAVNFKRQNNNSSRKSSYQNRLSDLMYAWQLLANIRDNLIKGHDGFTDEEIISEITEIIDDNFYVNVDDVESCPICGRFSSHSHSFD